MKTLLEYIEAQQKEYKFRLKFATPVDSDMHKKLESALAKFEATKVSKPKKTIIQGRQLDFPDAGPGESYIVDAVFAYPTTREAVRDTAAVALRISPSLLVVRSSEEPLETDRALTQPTGKALLTAEYEDLKAEDNYSNKAREKEFKEHDSMEFEYEAKSDVKANPGPEFTDKASTSPIGSTKVKMPKVTSSAR